MFIATFLLSVALGQTSSQPVKNGGFESGSTIATWVINPSAPKAGVSVTLDTQTIREGRHALLITAERAADVNLEQELFPPVVPCGG